MKKIFFVIFSLIMMCSFSFGMDANVEYSILTVSTSAVRTDSVGSYTPAVIYNILSNYATDSSNENYNTAFDTLIQDVESLGYKYIVFYNESNNMYYLLVNNLSYSNYSNVEFVKINEKIALIDTSGSGGERLGFLYGSNSTKNYMFSVSSTGYQGVYNLTSVQPEVTSIYKSNVDVYQMIQGSNSSKYYWDGFSYYYEVPEQGGSDVENPELTDDELAELVTRFTNSDALINNHAIGHDDYFITYDTLMGYYRAYTYNSNIDLAISYGDYDEEGNFVISGTEEGEAWQIRPYVFSGNVFNKLSDWLASKFNSYSFKYFSISPDSTISPRYVGMLQHSYCSNYKDYEVVVFTTKQIRFLGEKTTEEGETEVVVTDDYIPKTTLTNSETGEEYIFEIPEQNIGDTLYSQFVSLFQNLGDRIASIFEPDVTSVSYLKSTIENKLPVIGELKTIIDNLLAIFSNENPEPPTITIPLSQAESSIDYGADCIALDLSWYERYKDTVDLVIIGFAYAIFAWRLYQRIPGIISGADGINWGVFGTGKSEYSGSGNFGFKSGGGNK